MVLLFLLCKTNENLFDADSNDLEQISPFELGCTILNARHASFIFKKRVEFSIRVSYDTLNLSLNFNKFSI